MQTTAGSRGSSTQLSLNLQVLFYVCSQMLPQFSSERWSAKTPSSSPSSAKPAPSSSATPTSRSGPACAHPTSTRVRFLYFGPRIAMLTSRRQLRGILQPRRPVPQPAQPVAAPRRLELRERRGGGCVYVRLWARHGNGWECRFSKERHFSRPR